MREIHALQQLQSQWTPKLYSIFNEKEAIYILMEVCQAGSLRRLRDKNPELFTLPAIKFYAANIVLAIEDIHSQALIYRNLELENVKIDITGYCKLYNFQHTVLEPVNSAISLTADDMDRSAPEVITAQRHSHLAQYSTKNITSAVDLW